MSSQRVGAIDLLRGSAILWVMMIHANALPDTALREQIVDRAPLFFVILMGTSIQLWWRNRSAGALEWYRARARRLLVPVWCAVAVWWLLVVAFKPRQYELLSPALALQHACGILIGIGTGWFVTLAIGIALLAPLLHAAAKRFGTLPVLVLGIACTMLVTRFRFPVLYRLGSWGLQVFPLRYLAEVTFGMWLASRLGRLGRREAMIALGMAIGLGGAVWASRRPSLGLVQSTLASLDSSLWKPIGVAEQLLDLPLCVLLLVALSTLRSVTWIARPLAWLGVESFGLYLGQLLTHNLFLFWRGFPGQFMRWELYVLLLLAGGIAWVLLGRLAWSITQRGRRLELG